MILSWFNDGSAEDGFRDGIISRNIDARFYTFGTNRDMGVLEKQLAFIDKLPKDLIYVNGFRAASKLIKRFPETPIVFIVEDDPVKNDIIASKWRTLTNATGIDVSIPVLEELLELKAVRNFETIYFLSGSRTKKSDEKFREMERLGKYLKFDSVLIKDIKNIKKHMLKPFNKAKSAAYLTGSVSSEIGRGIKKLNIPVMAEKPEMVVNGYGMIATVVDMYRAGRLLSDKAAAVLSGRKASEIPVQTIRYFRLVVNLAEAERINVDVPLELLLTAMDIIR
ncbi:ABC transporter substrate binding protein [Flexistipes sp.]|uniref:ABC transporter substrate binding protein n=1 Tax=Flexistipes sp. TaxID=3088135 RepID=UPI002E20C359|nr:ABC transporter substrate binding protein [Flexistipes sp.]